MRTKIKEIKFIDLFAGIGGIRLGVEQACKENGIKCKCVFSSEIDKFACQTYEANFHEKPSGDITKINEQDIPSFDMLCAGFPCQPFSIAGKQKGFEDTRGTMFFEIARIVKYHKPKIVFLENVKNLLTHDKGRTFAVIKQTLEDLGYFVNYKVLNAKDFGVPQNRERIIIIANRIAYFNFEKLQTKTGVVINDILEADGDFSILDEKEYTILPKNMWKKQSSGLIFCGYRNKNIWKRGIRDGTEYLSRVHKQPNRIYYYRGTHPTISSQETSGRFFIYDDKCVRKLTINECYRLQGFPDVFKTNNKLSACYLQVGNSVAIPMIKSVFMEIYNQLLYATK